MIGLDTSHCEAFTEIIQNPRHPYHVPGGRVTVAYPGGSPNFPLSAARVGPITHALQERFGVRIATSIAQVAEQADAILLTSVDGRIHLQQFAAVAPFGKPVFIDKPLAVCFTDALRIFELARQHRVPLMSCSSLRRDSAPFIDVQADAKPYYASLIEHAMRFFRSGQSSVDREETLAIIRFIEAANESRQTGRTVSCVNR
nr:Gfo/Idh/MocA family oxidoreductase [Brevibacillus massiliensis]